MSRPDVHRISRSLVLLGLALSVAVPFAAPRATLGGVKDDEALNYFLKVPDEGWVFGRAEDFAKWNVAAVADRALALLADGKTAGTGQGARVMLSVQDLPKDFEPDYETWLYEWQLIDGKIAALEGGDIPEDLAKQESAAREKLEKPLAALAGRPEVQSLLLGRWFADVKKQPVLEVDTRAIYMSRIPAAEMKYDAPCANLQGNEGPCLGKLHVWVIRKKLYRLASWVWKTEYDREGLRNDRDMIEMDYQTPKSTAIPRKPPAPDTANDANAPKGDPDLDREFNKKDLAFQFGIKKVRRFLPVKIDRTRSDQKRLGWRMDGLAGPASCICELLVYSVRDAAEPFSVDQYLQDFWTMFLKTHPKGKIETAPFTPVSNKQPFLSLPDFAKKKEVDRPEKKPGKDKDGKDKEEKYSVSDEEKAGFITESKQIMIGKEKVKNTWRLCLMGNAERLGDEANIQYIFQTSDFCYVLRLVCRRDGVTVFKDSMAEILKSIELLEPPPK